MEIVWRAQAGRRTVGFNPLPDAPMKNTIVTLRLEFTPDQVRQLQTAAEFLGCPPSLRLSAKSVTVKSWQPRPRKRSASKP